MCIYRLFIYMVFFFCETSVSSNEGAVTITN